SNAWLTARLSARPPSLRRGGGRRYCCLRRAMGRALPHFFLGPLFAIGVFGGGLPLFPPFLDMDAAPYLARVDRRPGIGACAAACHSATPANPTRERGRPVPRSEAPTPKRPHRAAREGDERRRRAHAGTPAGRHRDTGGLLHGREAAPPTRSAGDATRGWPCGEDHADSLLTAYDSSARSRGEDASLPQGRAVDSLQ